MKKTKKINYKLYSNFLRSLAKELTNFYYSKLNKTFKISNKLKGRRNVKVSAAFHNYLTPEKLKKFLKFSSLCNFHVQML